MPEDAEEVSAGKERVVLALTTWFFYSTFLVAIVLIPLSIGTLYMTRFPTDLMSLRIEYTVLFGLGLGAILSLICGLILSRLAMKRME